MALQPTKRGAWCRADRKKSYRLGDLSVLIGRLTEDGSAISELVGGGLRGADRGERTWVARLAVPGASYATKRVEGAVLVVPRLASLACWGCTPRLCCIALRSGPAAEPLRAQRGAGERPCGPAKVADSAASNTQVIVPLCLGNNPTAAETSQRQPFSVRLWSSEPVLVRQTTSYPPAQVGRSARTVSWCGEIALQALRRPGSE